MNRNAFAINPELIGLGLIGLALLTVYSFIPETQTGIVLNWALFLANLMGWGYYLAWIALGYLGVWLFRRFGMENLAEKWEKPLGVWLLLLLFSAACEVFDPARHSGKGEAGGGGFIGWIVHQLLGDWGVLIFLLPVGLFFVIILLGPWSLRDVVALAGGRYERFRYERRVGKIPFNAPGEGSSSTPALALSASSAPPPPNLKKVPSWELPEIGSILKKAPRLA